MVEEEGSWWGRGTDGVYDEAFDGKWYLKVIIREIVELEGCVGLVSMTENKCNPRYRNGTPTYLMQGLR